MGLLHLYFCFNLCVGSETSQRPEQSADQVHEGAGGEGGGGAEEQRGGQQQQPRPRAGPVQAAGWEEVDIKDCEEKFKSSPIASSFVDLSYQVLNYSCVKKIYIAMELMLMMTHPRCWRAQRSWPEQETVSVGLSR